MWDDAILLRNIANGLIASSLLAMLYGATHYVMHMPGLFRLQTVQLGAAPQRISTADVLRVIRSEVRGNLLTADIGRLRKALEKLPWVRSVSIRREFPHDLLVKFEEHQAFGRWNDSALVNQYGETFVADTTQALPEFIGQEGTSAEIAQNYVQFSQQIAPLGSTVAQIALSPRHTWKLRLSDGTVLELGRDDVQQRLARFVDIEKADIGDEPRVRNGAIKYVDLRYRNGFAIRRANEKG